MSTRESAFSVLKVLRAEHVAAAPHIRELPPPSFPEIAFLGRSNVGKSSLLNRMVGRRGLARTSGTPGKTRLIHVYHVVRPEGEVRFVDLPGYGYARVSRQERSKWKPLVESYLEKRAALAGAVLLHDLRRDPGEDEELLLAWLVERRIPTRIAITKIDKLSRRERGERMKILTSAVPCSPEHCVATSARTGDGISALWQLLDTILERPAAVGHRRLS